VDADLPQERPRAEDGPHGASQRHRAEVGDRHPEGGDARREPRHPRRGGAGGEGEDGDQAEAREDEALRKGGEEDLARGKAEQDTPGPSDALPEAEPAEQEEEGRHPGAPAIEHRSTAARQPEASKPAQRKSERSPKPTGFSSRTKRGWYWVRRCAPEGRVRSKIRAGRSASKASSRWT